MKNYNFERVALEKGGELSFYKSRQWGAKKINHDLTISIGSLEATISLTEADLEQMRKAIDTTLAFEPAEEE